MPVRNCQLWCSANFRLGLMCRACMYRHQTCNAECRQMQICWSHNSLPMFLEYLPRFFVRFFLIACFLLVPSGFFAFCLFPPDSSLFCSFPPDSSLLVRFLLIACFLLVPSGFLASCLFPPDSSLFVCSLLIAQFRTWAI